MDFPEFAIYHESQWEFQLSNLGILCHHNQGWLKNLSFKLFLLIYLWKEFTILWRFYINITDCGGIMDYWSETIFITSLKKNIVSAKLFETPFSSNILASFTKFECWGTDTFGFIRFQTFKIHKVFFYKNNAWILL